MSTNPLQTIPGIRHRLIGPMRNEMAKAAQAQQYAIEFVNQSNNDWTFCCFQQDPTITDPAIMTLAWFSKGIASGAKATFTWSITYDFVWASTGILKSGVTFDASQTVPADLKNDNYIQFTDLGNGMFKFINESNGGTDGSLSIYCDNSIPDPKLKPNGAPSIGIGMSGQGTFALQALPNTTATFTPRPTYWITFGKEINMGQVMSAQQLTGAPQVSFPPQVTQCTATLGTRNQWTLTYQ